MQRAHARPTYTGYPAAPSYGHGGHHHGMGGGGFCAGCCHPQSSCCCGCRQCRKEARELLVEPTQTRDQIAKDPGLTGAYARMSVLHDFAAGSGSDSSAEASSVRVLSGDAINAAKLGLGTAFVGGSCCVHFSIEYTPTATADGMVGVAVHDSNDTQLMWVKKVAAGLGYQIKECIVTTKPGAHLTALAVGATARVRWCEVFSC